MVTKDILESYSVRELKKEISKRRMKNYAHLKKADLHNFIMKNKSKFMDLKKKEKTMGKVKKEVVKIEKKVKAQSKSKEPSNKNVPEDISKIIGEFVPKSNKMDTVKSQSIYIEDTPYFQTKVRELLVKKLGNKPYLKNNNKFKNLIKYIVAISNPTDVIFDLAFRKLHHEGFRAGQQLFTHDKKGKRMKTKGAAALFMAKILASPVATIKSGGKKEVFIEYLIKNSTGSIKSYNKLFSVLKTDPDKPRRLIEEIKKGI